MEVSKVSNSVTEKVSSRLGFILLAAGCAIGLGNVWRFPYIVGENGGGIFVLIYILCLLLIGVPVVMLELSLGRATGKSVVKAFNVAEAPGAKWHLAKYFMFLGPYILLGFYSVLTGWLFYYLYSFLCGDFNFISSLSTEQASQEAQKLFGDFINNPKPMLTCTILVLVASGLVVLRHVSKGVEAITKPLMLFLLLMLISLVVYCSTLDGAIEGLKYYLYPDIAKAQAVGWKKVFIEALNQSFFTLSVGQGSLLIFGSYTNKQHSLVKESLLIAIIDFIVAFLAGFIIFPACITYGIQPDSGPNLLFITLINVFARMDGGQFIGSMFFFFMFVAAFTTLATVFEGIVASFKDLLNVKRIPSVFINTVVLIVLGTIVALGFNVLSDIHPLGGNSNFLDLGDFLVSTNILPFGAFFMSLFAILGWGYKNFANEVNTGKGMKLPRIAEFYYKFILPVIIGMIILMGYSEILSKWID